MPSARQGGGHLMRFVVLVLGTLRLHHAQMSPVPLTL